ncbi:nitronate monooxygenase [Bdellovibrio bacteriovorus]|uniref:Putative 2-nitropropane dioxygenase n=1 Tax=Bdellovibrio bacteriovorus (strain ATCC 15356 / DSM 50701 / NCIMB 9529 / HD100) TaxID=264462 RepID=Q6MMD1_BDEBA|nr:putative 2-nitropropane dioxygenase [Bdellovibrio bacteriovorus HD100]
MQFNHPIVIQGGMGIAVSDWRLAKTVSQTGQLGVVSGTAINSVLVRRLQDGDAAGDCRRALKAFPSQEIAQKILDTYFIEGGRPANQPYKRPPMFNLESPKALLQLTVAASFVEVWLAREGHNGLIGLNLLEKVVLPNLACLYGGLLAGVDYVIMGAGIPREIPGALDLLAQNQKATLKVPVAGAAEDGITSFDPQSVMEGTELVPLKRPYFFPIVSSAILAANLKKKSTGRVDGFIVEGPLAGGHNAPPRGPMKLNERGEPVYGTRDEVCLKEMAALELPFWMAGYYATPEKLAEVRAQGAHGVQVGTLFAFSEESGVKEEHKAQALKKITTETAPEGGWIFTDPRSSPTGFPFKAARLSGTISEEALYLSRKRICDLGYLRHAYQKPDGSVGQRCPAEPVNDYVKKGGLEEDTVGRKCLCNALMADVGMGQIQAGGVEEQPLLTAGDDLNNVARMLKGKSSYSARDVVAYLLGLDGTAQVALQSEAPLTV